MNHSTPGLPVYHQLPEFTETHVHRVSDAIQPSHPLSSPSPSSPTLIFSMVTILTDMRWYLMVLICLSSSDQWCWASFHVPVGHLYVFIGKMSIQLLSLSLKLNWVLLLLNCMSSSYILDVNLLSVILFVNIFSHAVGCLFVLLMISFVVQRLLCFFRSFFIFNFCLYFFCLMKDRR